MEERINIGFTGTQRGMTPNQKTALHICFRNIISFTLHHGDCIGSDSEAHDIARQYKGRVVVHPPDVAKKRAFCEGDHVHRPYPYLNRNKYIVVCSDIVVGVPKSIDPILRSGTWFTIRYARRLRKPQIIINPEFVFIEKGGNTYDEELRRVIAALQRSRFRVGGDSKEIQKALNPSVATVLHQRK